MTDSDLDELERLAACDGRSLSNWIKWHLDLVPDGNKEG